MSYPHDSYRPPRALLKDHLIIEIARHGWSRPEQLRSLRGQSLGRDALERISAAVRRGLAIPADQRPKPIEVDDDTSQEEAIRQLVAAVLTEFGRTEGIALQLLATTKDVRALVLSYTRGSTPLGPGALQSGWRKRLIGRSIDDILAGRQAIRVITGEDGPRIVLE